MANVGYYAANGSWNISIIDGTTITGIYATDGSMNCVEATGLVSVGLTHPCGARWVTLNNDSTPIGFYAPDGSMYVTDDGTKNGATKVTVISGSLGGGTSYMLLLALTSD